MSTEFITNNDTLLSTLINDLLKSTNNLSFLVGYFYFSGFKEICDGLEDKNIRILVGMDLEKSLKHDIMEINYIQERNLSRGEIKSRYLKSIMNLINDTDILDRTSDQKNFRMFLNKLRDGSLEIKKTTEPNHAKMYLFEKIPEFSEGGSYPGALITGSSNLTSAGLRHQGELNVIFRDKTYDLGIELFDELWNKSVNIVDLDSFDDFFTNLVEKVWIDKLPKPYLVFVRVLIEYFSNIPIEGIKQPGEITNGKFLNFKYQFDAIAQSISIINQHNGVIIADVVGLGKSIIASAVAHNLNKKIVIICPPHLKPQWEDYAIDFWLVPKIYSSGKIEEAYLDNIDIDEQKLIIIDEAHKYRNENTQDYAMLHKLCQKHKVMLLTATPFNNRPQDIFSMIKLFQIPTRSTIQTIDNLSYQFRAMIKDYNEIQKERKKKGSDIIVLKSQIELLAKRIRDIISPLVIRRSRIDLDAITEYKVDLSSLNISFPIVEPPELCEYDLGQLSDLYKGTLEKIAPENESGGGYIGARYKPVTYIKDIEKFKKRIAEIHDDIDDIRQAQINLATFMRRLLVHRFESSMNSFKKSLEFLITSSEYVRDWYYKYNKVPIYKKGNLPDLERLDQINSDDIDDELKEINFNDELKKYIEKGLVIIKKEELTENFIKDLEYDINLLTIIRNEWFKDGFPHDPKLDFIKTLLKKKLNENKKRKIVIFSEYADTVDYVYNHLKNDFKIFSYTAAKSSKENKDTIKANFDAGIELTKQSNDYDILIASDAISEGYNLHRAGIIFNYDIPYNPTRVIQRVGRINRINKKMFENLYIYNFFPTHIGEKETSIKKITTLKMAMIHALIGEDTRILTSDEELRSYFTDEYNKKNKELNEEKSWDVEYRNMLNNLLSSKDKLIEAAESIHRRTRIGRKSKDKSGVLIFGKKGTECMFKYSDSHNNIETFLTEDAFKMFKADVFEDAFPVSEKFEDIYQHLKKNLFSTRTTYPVDKPKSEAMNKLTILAKEFPADKDYLEDLKTAIKEYDSIVELHLKMIRSVSSKSLEKDLKKIKLEIPHEYLIDIIHKAKSIDDAEEIVIFSEEFGV